MKRNKYILQSFLVLGSAGMFLFIFSFGGTAAYEAVKNSEDQLPDDTRIGGVDVGGMSESQANTYLQEETVSWQHSAVITLQLFDETVAIDPSMISFDLEKSIETALAANGGDAAATANLDQHSLEDSLQHFSFTQVRDRISLEKLEKTLTNDIDITDTTRNDIDVGAHFDVPLEETIINEATVHVDKPPSYLNDWVKALDGYVLEAVERFSLLDALDKRGASVFQDPALDQLASAVYQSIAETNFVVTERHINPSLPVYADLGEDVHLQPGEADLGFYNPNNYTYVLRVSVEGNQLTASLEGPPFLHNYSLELEQEKTISPQTVVRFDESRVAGDKEVLSNGKDGSFARLQRQERNGANRLVEEIEMGQDYYPPSPRIEEWSLQDRSALGENQIPEEDGLAELPGETNESKRESGQPDGEEEIDNGDDSEKEQENDSLKGEEELGGQPVSGSDNSPIKGYD